MKNIFISLSILLLFIFSSFDSYSEENPYNADIVVAADGSGDFTAIQAAIDAAPSDSERRTVIYLKRGLYDAEKIFIAGDKKNITLVGESREETIISYHIYDCSGGKCPTADAAKWTGDNIRTSATITIHGDGFHAENLTIQNTAGPVGQAQAITVRSDKCVFINCDLKSYQDTLYFWNDGKRTYFEGCLIVGRTDYIYGGGIVFFQSCEIRSWGGGWITAPSTAMDNNYGFVFNECELTYALNSPRSGDDGSTIRFGRPWHNYPKVTWLRCDITEKLNPQGWGDTWNMSYASTSSDLHLYEYKNTGAGADMSNRANWAGIKELSDEEALEYTVQKVLAGNDSWDPTADAAMVQTYNWTGAVSTDWMVAENWDPVGIPAEGDVAVVTGERIIEATGGSFQADLYLKDTATLNVSANSTASYISVNNGVFITSAEVTLDGRIATKGEVEFNIAGIFILDSSLSGVHNLIKNGSGNLILAADNVNFSGDLIINEGKVEGSASNSLGKGAVNISSGATLVIEDDNAFQPKSKLEMESGALLELNANITTSEVFIDGLMQAVGEYTSETNPELISGSGRIIIGRPEVFTFIGGSNGNWDNPSHFIPALLPLSGETVISEKEMETTSTVFEGNIILRGAGSLRLRGSPSKNHTSTGDIHLEEGTSFRYNTGGTGMQVIAPLFIDGDVRMIMESGNSEGSVLTLPGKISGSSKITAVNNGKGTLNTGTLLLTGDNSAFTGILDITENSAKYPGSTGYITYLEGKGENSFGSGTITAGLNNRVVFSHSKAAGDSLVLNLSESAKVLFNSNVSVKSYILNGEVIEDGVYSASTNPVLYEGSGKLIVGDAEVEPEDKLPAFPGAEGHGKYVTGGRGGKVIYVTTLEDNNSPGSLRYAINQTGPRIIIFNVSGTIKLKSRLNINKKDITIAGQTAPGDGITIRDYPVVVDADNVIIRFLRFRMGDETDQEADALGGRYNKNIIIDHCSMSWSTDECVSFYHNEDFTLQWSIISESLKNSVHAKGSHGYGGIWGGKNASFHHNLLAHHDSRNPRLGESKGDVFALTDLVDLRNNVIYNWKGNSCYGGEAMNVNIVNCYYKPGPVTTKKERIISIDKLTDSGYAISNIWGKFYIDGNVLTGSTRATNDNWTYGVYNQFNAKYTVPTLEREAMRMSEPHNPGEVTTHTAEMAYEKILDFGGASLARDSVDIRIVHDVSTGTATYMTGGNGSTKGIVDTQSAVGGWPELLSTDAPDDSDNDGMPDFWEIENNLDPESDADAQLQTVDGEYPNIEVYINSLVSDIIEDQNDESTSASVKLPVQKDEDINILLSNSTGILSVNHDQNIKTVQVYSVTGGLLKINNFNQPEVEMNLQELSGGIYIIRVADSNNSYFSKKVIKF